MTRSTWTSVLGDVELVKANIAVVLGNVTRASQSVCPETGDGEDFFGS